VRKYFRIAAIFAFVLLSVSIYGMTNQEKIALKTIQAEIKNALSGKSSFARKVGRYSDFYRELIKVLKTYKQLGIPKTMKVENRAAKILVPFNLNEKMIAGFFQVSADGKKIISYLPWDKNLTPLFKVNRKKWESAKFANDLEEIKELRPISDSYSAGIPVEISDLTDLYLIDYVDFLPTKTQEEREAYTSKNGLKATLGRRTGSSKCLSYAASLASDWWNIATGRKIGKYDSFVNGAREFGMNPRVVESLYFNHKKCPYSFVKKTGLDRVTGEKIPYSPKHYAYIMSSIKHPKKIQDPLKKSNSYILPENKFGMDLPFTNCFNKTNGKIEKIKADLKRYGIMYAQHTSRLFNNKVSMVFQGVHACNIVGTAKYKGKPVVVYYETFGKNSRDYIEDSFYGPALRVFPVKFFYQGIQFPHRIIPDVRPGADGITVRFLTHDGKKISPEQVTAVLDGKVIKVSPRSVIKIPASKGEHELVLKYSRRYFYLPEEPNGYKRTYLISGSKSIELNRYESVLIELAKRRGGLFTKIFGKKESYTDHLKQLEERLRNKLIKQVNEIRADGHLLKRVDVYVSKNKILRKSDFAKKLKEVVNFNKIK
jgi:hypothetical protein